MAKITNSMDRTGKMGFCGMSGKTNMGKPRHMTKGMPAGSTSKADMRGKGDACLKG